MNLDGYAIGVCSWSLHPAGAEDLVRRVRALGLGHVQIALGPLVDLDEHSRKRELKILLDSGIEFTGGMISFPGEDYSTIADIRRTGGFVPDAFWPDRKRRFLDTVELARQLSLNAITTHVGFIPPSDDPGQLSVVLRLAELVANFPDDIRLLMETGQEPAAELAALLTELDNVVPGVVGINFDPANMILYGAGDPIEAVGILGKWIGHVHVKDAIASAKPGEVWGTEVPFGTGQVGAAAFLRALKSVGYTGALAIEREAGADRASDIAAAIEALRSASAR
jgi:L-ribulose-5-phosphate 3-epimerase